MFNNIVNFESKEFTQICKSHSVKELYAFGSVVNGNFTDESDIDLLIEIDEPNPLTRGELLLSIWNYFELYFKRKVDVPAYNSLRNPFLKESINNSKKLVYAGLLVLLFLSGSKYHFVSHITSF
jgi:predicted nucleotidyltransferase